MLTDAWHDLLTAAHGGEPERVAVALGVDCVFAPAAAGLNTLDYFLYPRRWFAANLALIDRFPALAIFPGFWVEYGMANEPSAFGAPVMWKGDDAPAIRPLDRAPETWGALPVPDPRVDGLMALVVRRYWALEREGGLPEPHRVRIVAARGPFTTAAHLVGMTDFLAAAAEPEAQEHVAALLAITTETTIRFLQAQVECLRQPAGVLVLDDTVGLLSPRLFERLAVPALNRVFDAFDGLLRLYHNDTPCPHLLRHMDALHFDLWHFSHKMPVADVRAALPDRALMGNISPLLLRDGTPDEVEQAARAIIARAGRRAFVLAPGGGTNAGTPFANIDALVRAAGR